MELTPFVDAMRRDLSAATALADEPTRNIVDRLGTTLDTTARLAMYDALSQACAEISRELSPGAVEVRLAGRDPQFVVTAPPRVTPTPPTPPVPPTAPIPPIPPLGTIAALPPLATTTVLPIDDGAGPDDEAGDSQGDTDDSDGGSARITLRLPGNLKNRVDEAAARSGLSVNAWLVQAVQDAVGNQRGRDDRNRDRNRDRGRRGGFDLGLGNLGAEISREVNEAMREVNRELKNAGRQIKQTPGTQVTGWFR
jgi:HicB family